jgi:hypothetical protein
MDFNNSRDLFHRYMYTFSMQCILNDHTESVKLIEFIVESLNIFVTHVFAATRLNLFLDFWFQLSMNTQMKNRWLTVGLDQRSKIETDGCFYRSKPQRKVHAGGTFHLLNMRFDKKKY